MRTTVAVIGAGPAGLTLANLLRHAGIDCVVLERQQRGHIEHRQRAGVLDSRAVRMLEESGLDDLVLPGIPASSSIQLRLDGQPYLLDFGTLTDGLSTRLCTQQVLVQRLIAGFLDGGGDLRFGVRDVRLRDLAGERPVVGYRDPSGVDVDIECDYVAGCDGDRGVSRTSVPDGALSTYDINYGLGWLSVLAEAPPLGYLVLASSRSGFAAHFPRGPQASRYYLQCRQDDDVRDWPDDRIWRELRLRLGVEELPTGPVSEKTVVALRSTVHEPMAYGRLYLAGDAAHIVTPLGGKGMNLALGDAYTLARALRAAVRDGDESLLRGYSEACLHRVWDVQEQSAWMVEMLHSSMDTSPAGRFRDRLARARLERVFRSATTTRMLAEFMAGAD